MKRFFLLAVLSTLFATMSTAQVKLTVVVDSIRNSEGKIMVAFFNAHDTFLKQPSYSTMANAKEGSTELTMNLPAGEYAIALFHDVNSNMQLDMSKKGIPTEPFGFSNNVYPLSAPPTFKECRFLLDKDKTIHIHLNEIVPSNK